MKTVVIMCAGGRDFHDFNVRFRHDPETRVVAFTAAQIRCSALPAARRYCSKLRRIRSKS